MIRRARQVVNVLLHVDDAPERTALAFAIGIWIAFFPIIGIHTVMALGIAFAFRLNRVAILLGAYLSNPWTVAPMFMAGTALGCVLLGVSPSVVWSVQWRDTWSIELLHRLRPLLLPYVVGNILLGTLSSFVAYLSTRSLLLRRRAGSTSPPPSSDAPAPTH